MSGSHLHIMPWGELQVLMDELAHKGHTKEEIEDIVVRKLDELLPAYLLPPPFGTIAELLDGPGIRAALHLAISIAHRKAERAKRKAAKKAK
jgi:hypothetical protein